METFKHFEAKNKLGQTYINYLRIFELSGSEEMKKSYILKDEIKVNFSSRQNFIQMCRKTPGLSYGDIRHVHRIYASN